LPRTRFLSIRPRIPRSLARPYKGSELQLYRIGNKIIGPRSITVSNISISSNTYAW
jgi:hypothetical protein